MTPAPDDVTDPGPIIFPGPAQDQLTDELARRLRWERGQRVLREFPDGEAYIRIDSPVRGRPVWIACSLHRPNEALLQTLLLAETLRDLGARSVSLVAPYLAYMRQDERFQPGEAVTARYCARLLSQYFDALVTVDPHLHRLTSLAEIYDIPTEVASSAPAVADWLSRHIEAPFLVGPDAESAQWVEAIADRIQAPRLILRKVRRGDRDVTVSAPEVLPAQGRTVVVIDDIISTGETMLAAVAQLQRAGLRVPLCIGLHGVFAEDIGPRLAALGVERIVTTNTIAHPTATIDVLDALAQAIAAVAPNT
jgi:ribose-phosphate pyrophosphokinase